MMIAILVLALLTVVTDPVGATTYYVATNGSDSNNGTDETTPWLTVKKAVDTMVAGDTTFVRGGTYSQSAELRFTRTGTSSSPIRLLNYPGESPTLQFTDRTNAFHRISLWNSAGDNKAIGWIVIEGFHITNGGVGIRFYSAHDVIIRRNTIYNNQYQGLLGYGTRIVIDRNIVSHNGNFAGCAAGTTACNREHGIYMNGTAITVTNNLIYDNLSYGITLNGSGTAAYNAAIHAGPEFAVSHNWIIANNTFAYNKYRSGIVVWGSRCNNARIENNIFYENSVSSSSPNGIDYTSATDSPGVMIRNNHFYASGSGGTASTGGTAPTGVTFTGNVVNVSAPAFVNGGADALPASPDFRLTASSPVNIALANEFLNNSTNVVGAFKTIANPTASIKANIVTLTFPMATAVPIQIPSSTGVSVGCTGANCPGSPTVGSASRKTGTDTQVEVMVNGISGNACVSTNQTWTITYNTSTGGWTGFDNVGIHPGQHQKVFSFTSLSVTNLCDGGGPGGGGGGGVAGTLLIEYDLDEGTGTVATNTGSTGSADNGTLANGAGWTTGKTGSGVNITGGTQQVQVPHGSGINPTTQSMTWVLAVQVPPGGANATRFEFGSQIGTNQRAYVGASGGTWRVASQSTNLSSAAVSNLIVDEGWNHLCVNWDSATDVVTLYKNGVAGTGGATRAYTSFTLPSDILLGITGSGFPSAMAPGVYDNFLLYDSTENCTSIYNDWNAPTVAVGTFGMPAYRFQAVYLPELGGSPLNFGTAINQPKDVVVGGAISVLLELHCQNVADCESDGFRLEARQNGTGSYLQVPSTETNTQIFMWGQDASNLLNTGTTTSRISAGSCAVTNGATVLTSAQVPVVDLPQDGCTVLRYTVRIGSAASGYFELRLAQQNGTALTGTVVPARINVIPMQAGH